MEGLAATLAMRNLKLEEIDPFALRNLSSCTYSMLCTDHKKCMLRLEEYSVSSNDEWIGELLHQVSKYKYIDLKLALQKMLLVGPETFKTEFELMKKVASRQSGSGRVVYDHKGWDVKMFELGRVA